MTANKSHRLVKRLRVDTYQVQKSMFIYTGGELKKTVTLGLSPLFGSRFAAVKALRKIRKTHPIAQLVHARVLFTEQGLSGRAALLAMAVRPGERP